MRFTGRIKIPEQNRNIYFCLTQPINQFVDRKPNKMKATLGVKSTYFISKEKKRKRTQKWIMEP